jgi:hypothetical protein
MKFLTRTGEKQEGTELETKHLERNSEYKIS